MSRTRIYTDQERKEKAREQSRKYWESLTLEQKRAYNRRNSENYRKNNYEKYRKSQNELIKKWMSNPQNRFSHHARTRLLYYMKKTQNKLWLRNIALGKEIDHIIPLKVFAEFFFEFKRLDVMIDQALKSAAIEVVNHYANIRYLEPTENVRGRFASRSKILKVASVLEDRFPVLCDGLEEYMIDWLKEIDIVD